MRAHFLASLTALLVTTLAAAPAAFGRTYRVAADITPNSAFATFLNSKDHYIALAKIAAADDQAVGIDCVADYKVNLVALRILSPIEQPDDAPRPVAGNWSERYNVQRCGSAKAFNAIFTATADKVELTWGSPGTTTLDPRLVRDLEPVIVPKAVIKNCKERKLLDTAPGVPGGYHKKVRDGRYETWTVTGCGKNVDLILLVTQPGKGKFNVKVEDQRPAAAR